MTSKCTMYRPCSHFFLQFHIVSDVVKITIYCSCFLCSFNRFKLRQNARQVYISCFQNYPCSSTLFKISSECTLYCPCFLHYLYSYKYRQNAPFTVLVFKIPRRLPSFSRPSPWFQYKILIIFLIAVIFQNSVKRQALATLFS